MMERGGLAKQLMKQLVRLVKQRYVILQVRQQFRILALLMQQQLRQVRQQSKNLKRKFNILFLIV